MYGPAVRCKKKRQAWRVRSCINVSGLVLELMLRTIMEIRAPSDLITGHASEGYWGHQFSDALERPFLHLFYFSRRPRWGTDRGAYIACILIACSSFCLLHIWMSASKVWS